MNADIQTAIRVNEVRLLGIIFCVYIALSVLKNVRFMSNWYRSHFGLFQSAAILGAWRPPKLSVRWFPLFLVAFLISLLAYAFWANRIVGICSLILYFSIFPGIKSFSLVHQKSSLIPLVLSILLLSNEFHGPFLHVQPVGEATAKVQWPAVCIRLILSIVYFSIGMEKMIQTGWRWTEGMALRWYLLEHYLWGNFKCSVPLFQHRRILRVLSTVTVLMQFLAPLIVFGGWLPVTHGIVALGFHLSTQIFMGIYFLTFFGPALVSSAFSYPLAQLMETYLPLEHYVETAQGVTGTYVSSTGWQVSIMFAIPLFQVYCHVMNRQRFPFAPYRLFSRDRSEFKDVGVLMLELGNASGEYRPWKPLDYYDVRDVSYFGYDRIENKTRLSPLFETIFSIRYWHVIMRESEDDGQGIQSIRLVSRTPAWRNDVPIGYDDYVIGLIHINGDQVGSVIKTTPIVHLRTHRF